MNKNNNVRIHWIVFVCFTAFYFIGCTNAPVKKPFGKLCNDQIVAIVPFINLSGQPISKVSALLADKSDAPVHVENILTDALILELKRRGFENVIVLPKLTNSEAHKFSLKTIENNLSGKIDVVIMSRILRFNERQGSKYAVKVPASVAFDFRLIRVVDGKVINQYEYRETQKALFDNILNLKKFIERKGQWVRAVDLALYGLIEGVEKITE